MRQCAVERFALVPSQLNDTNFRYKQWLIPDWARFWPFFGIFWVFAHFFSPSFHFFSGFSVEYVGHVNRLSVERKIFGAGCARRRMGARQVRPSKNFFFEIGSNSQNCLLLAWKTCKKNFGPKKKFFFFRGVKIFYLSRFFAKKIFFSEIGSNSQNFLFLLWNMCKTYFGPKKIFFFME